MNSEEIRELFESHLFKTANCWYFQGSSMHGRSYLKINGKRISPRRISWLLYHGEELDNTMMVKISCTEKMCVNPDHLYCVPRTYGWKV
jgi:hypothetical protein